MIHRLLVACASAPLLLGSIRIAPAQTGQPDASGVMVTDQGATDQGAPPQSRYRRQPGPQVPSATAGPASAVAPTMQRQQIAVIPASGQAAPTRPPGIAPREPFQLTPAEEAFLDQVLRMWETESSKIITFKCAFERWEYVRAFTPTDREIPLVKSCGHLAFAKPDKGSFKIEEIYRWQENTGETGKKEDTWPKSENEVGERWVCDGKNVYNYNQKAKQLQVSTIPTELQGKAIVDGPLPFLFGAKAEKLKQRYWIRVSQSNGETIWLDAYPKCPDDAANYRRVEVILDSKALNPQAMQVYTPNNDRTVYMFEKPSINSQLDRFFGVFQPPRTPFGWKRVTLDVPKRPNQAQAARRLAPRTRY